MKFQHTLCLILMLAAFSAHAGQFAVSLEQDKVVVGEKVDLLLIYLESELEASARFPNEISCELLGGGQKYTVTAKKNFLLTKSWKIEDHSSARQYYSFNLPNLLQGQVVVSLTDFDAPRVVLDVALPKGEDIGAADTVHQSHDAMFTVYEPYQKNAASYEPVYFLVGTEPEKSKFQISFKYRLFDADSVFGESNPWVQGLHFGYTQTSFWDLKSDSAPFADTSYKPELFWLSRNFLASEYGFLKGVFLQGGLQHESNGRGGDLSRSTNYGYIKPIFVLYDEDSRMGLEVSTKIWTYINNEDETNANLADYRGYFDFGVHLSLAESFAAGTQFRWADEGLSFQLDISYPLHRIFGDALDIYFYAEYSNQLAESLLEFEERTQAFRLGLAFIR